MATRLTRDAWLIGTGQHKGMERAIAISVRTVGSRGLYSSIVTTAPGEQTRVHHHGECETSIYILSGKARYSFGPTGVEERFDANAGDFVYIPAGTPHLPVNASSTEACVALVARTDPNEQESVVLLPELDGLPHLH